MSNPRMIHFQAFAAAVLLLAASAGAQTLATGDSRSVSQPSYPAICTTLSAQFSTSQRSSPPTTDDTSRIQAALTSCAGTGKSVVLAASGSNNAFYSDSITVSGEGLVINSGVTLYGNTGYAKQFQLVYVTGTNAFIGGPGTIDGRGDIVSSTPRLVEAEFLTNFIIYNVTLTQAKHPNLYIQSGNGATVWGVTIRTPADRKNADGIDIDSITNVTVTNSSVNAGDDGIAVKTNVSAASNITVKNSKFYGTHGLSIGSQTMYGVSNVLFTGNYVYGTDLNGIVSTDPNAIRVKTDPTCGGPVDKVLYTNTCMTGIKHLIVLDTDYGSCSGNPGTPVFTNIVVNGAVSTSSDTKNAYSRFRGFSASALINAYVANIALDTNLQNTDQDAIVDLDNVDGFLPAGTDVTTGSFTLSGSVPTCSF
jgi:polygalacturonase